MSEKIKANNVEAATKQMAAYHGIELPKGWDEINDREKNIIHAIHIDHQHNAAKKRYDTKGYIKQFTVESYEAHKEQMVQLGYGEMFIFHDPRIKEAAPDNKQEILDLISIAVDKEQVESVIPTGEKRKEILKAAKEKIESFTK